MEDEPIMDESKPKKKIERADMLKSFDVMDQMAKNEGDKENIRQMKEKMNEHLNQFETPEFKDKLKNIATVGAQMKQEGWTKEKVNAMSPEERQAFGRQMMERMGLPIPDKLKKKIEKE